eukprot:gene20554-22576_t
MSSRAENCGGIQSTKTLSFVTAGISSIVSLCTIAMNGLLMTIMIKQRKTILRQLFYKIIFNIILSDLLNGLIADNLTLNYVIKEGLNVPLPRVQITMSHVTFFVFGSVSVVTMGVLGIERQWAILHPFSYRVIGMHTKAVYALFTSIWILSGLMSLIYLWLGFHSSLVIFASVTVTLSFVVMFATCVIYYCRLIRKPRRIGRKAQPRIKNENETVITPTSVGNDPPCANQGSLPVAVKNPHNNESSDETTQRVEQKRPKHAKEALRRPKLIRRDATVHNSKHVATKVEKQATKTFLLISIVFIVIYLPTCIMMVYMNSCDECDCVTIHTLRDLTYLTMVSGSLQKRKSGGKGGKVKLTTRHRKHRPLAKSVTCGLKIVPK